MKVCKKCNQGKAVDLFSKNRTTEDGLQRYCKECSSKANASYYLRNAARICERNDAWAAANPEKVKAAEYAYSRSEKVRERSRAYRDSNKERLRIRQAEWRARNPENERIKSTKWASANRGTKSAGLVRYRAKKYQRTPGWADLELIAFVYEYCAYLNAPKKGQFHVDHIYPLRGDLVSGLHVIENLQILTKYQNSAKGNRLPSDTADLTPAYQTQGFLNWLNIWVSK